MSRRVARVVTLVVALTAGAATGPGCALVDAYLLADPDTDGGDAPPDAGDGGNSDAGDSGAVVGPDAGATCGDAGPCGDCCPGTTMTRHCEGDASTCSQVRFCTDACLWSTWGLCQACGLSGSN